MEGPKIGPFEACGKLHHVENCPKIGLKRKKAVKCGPKGISYGLQALRNVGVTKVSQFGTWKEQKSKLFVDRGLGWI